jgi:GDPmannose 4,6-dehydratase
MFGDVLESPQTERTPFNAQSPYGIAKLFAHETAKRYRDAYKLFISCGILFNHESERRGENFVSRKIAIGVAKIQKDLQDKLFLGNLDAKRDWGYAPEYVEAMWLMLGQKIPDDFVVATGETHTVREFADEAFKVAGINLVWKGKGLNEKGINKKNGNVIVEIDPKYFRANEVNYLCGDSTKAKKILDWKPKTNFKSLVRIMMESELKNAK